MSDWRDEAWAKLPEVAKNLAVRYCTPMPCPPSEETTLEVERCPTLLDEVKKIDYREAFGTPPDAV